MLMWSTNKSRRTLARLPALTSQIIASTFGTLIGVVMTAAMIGATINRDRRNDNRDRHR
jgi:hypothetical protein